MTFYFCTVHSFAPVVGLYIMSPGLSTHEWSQVAQVAQLKAIMLEKKNKKHLIYKECYIGI